MSRRWMPSLCRYAAVASHALRVHRKSEAMAHTSMKPRSDAVGESERTSYLS